MSLLKKIYDEIPLEEKIFGSMQLDLAVVVAHLMEKHGMTKADLGRATGLSPKSVVEILRGNVNVTLKNYCKAANCV